MEKIGNIAAGISIALGIFILIVLGRDNSLPAQQDCNSVISTYKQDMGNYMWNIYDPTKIKLSTENIHDAYSVVLNNEACFPEQLVFQALTH